ncbi:hypothetical protein WI26_24885 [Burkholderia diffusa]|nr:hypothetical protein WI26_24885 [Burkholderia diffusa]
MLIASGAFGHGVELIDRCARKQTATRTSASASAQFGTAEPLPAHRAPFPASDEKKPRLHPRGGANPCQ